MTTSASLVAASGVGGHGDVVDAVGRLGRLARGESPLRRLIEDHERTPREDVPDHLDVAVALDAGADDRDAGADARAAVRPLPDRHTGDRRGPSRGDGPAIDDRDRQSSPSIVEDDRRVDRGQPERPVRPEPERPI